jgi:hypothetical protein
MLCNYCRQIPFRKLFAWEPEERLKLYLHQPTFQDLEASAKSGCKLCRLLIEGLDEDRSGSRGLGYYPGFLTGDTPSDDVFDSLGGKHHIGIYAAVTVDTRHDDVLRPVWSCLKVTIVGHGTVYINIFTRRGSYE